MRTAGLWGVVLAALVAGLVWGASFNSAGVPPRPQDMTVNAAPEWYERLPTEPAAATLAYLDRVPAEMRARGEAYSETRLLGFVLRLLTLIAATAFLCMTGFAASMRERAARSTDKPVFVSAIVALQYFVVLYALSLPSEIYARFMRPHWFGFSDQPFVAWMVDDLTNWGVITLFYIVGVLLIYRFIRRNARTWVIWAIGTYVVLRTLYALLSPNVIEPLTNDFRPLAEGPQKQEILALARANGIAHPSVVVSNASAQSRLLNAHVSGIGDAARITVNDTTLARTSDPMLRAVLAHEIGHFVLNHTTMSIVSDSLLAGAGFLVVAFGTGALVRRFGARWRMKGVDDIATLPLFWGLFVLWGFISLPASNTISRVYEHQADLFALNASQAPHGLAEFMIHDADTSRLQPTALEYALFFSHPSSAERIEAAMIWRAEQGTQRSRAQR